LFKCGCRAFGETGLAVQQKKDCEVFSCRELHASLGAHNQQGGGKCVCAITAIVDDGYRGQLMYYRPACSCIDCMRIAFTAGLKIVSIVAGCRYCRIRKVDNRVRLPLICERNFDTDRPFLTLGVVPAETKFAANLNKIVVEACILEPTCPDRDWRCPF